MRIDKTTLLSRVGLVLIALLFLSFPIGQVAGSSDADAQGISMGIFAIALITLLPVVGLMLIDWIKED